MNKLQYENARALRAKIARLMAVETPWRAWARVVSRNSYTIQPREPGLVGADLALVRAERKLERLLARSLAEGQVSLPGAETD